MNQNREKDGKTRSIKFLNNVPLMVTAELSGCTISLRDLLQLKIGSIITLEKLAGEPMDILVNKQYLARGEILVSNGKYSVRLTDMKDVIETLNSKYNDRLVERKKAIL